MLYNLAFITIYCDQSQDMPFSDSIFFFFWGEGGGAEDDSYNLMCSVRKDEEKTKKKIRLARHSG